jgi:DNA polymerase type B, organellar and viral
LAARTGSEVIDLLPIVLRVHTKRLARESDGGNSRVARRIRWGELVLIFDTETMSDAAQALTFGSARLCVWQPEGTLKCAREYLFHADDLEKHDPAGYATLKKYAREHRKEHRLTLTTRRGFADTILWGLLKGKTLIVGFNLPFDLSRLAIGWAEGRGRYAKGFSLILCDTIDKRTGKRVEYKYRSRMRIKHIDSKRALMDIASTGKDRIRAKLHDLRTLSFALTNKGHSLASACEAFGVEHGKLTVKRHGRITPQYINYNRRDVLATQELLEKLRAEFDKLTIDLDPSNAMSPASIAKAYLRAMGIAPPRTKFADLPIEITAAAMTAYYGGRAECRIRRTVLPVVYCDFLSMYPTVNTLMRLWRILTAASLTVVDATAEVRNLLDGINLDQCFEPATWSKFNFFALVEPCDDILPVRAPYAEGSRTFNIGVNPLTYDHPLPFAGPDVVADKLRSGKTLRVTKAWRLVAKGLQAGLRPVRLRNEITIDPASDDFFRAVIERRKVLSSQKNLSPEEQARLDLFLKILANSGSYGIYAQLDRIDLPEKEPIKVYGLNGPFIAMTNVFERPGEFYFPPLAALITSGARLMLMLLERCVTNAKGSYALCDTDSMAIALSMQKVNRIVKRFEALNPYDRSIVPGSILNVEEENFETEEP